MLAGERYKTITNEVKLYLQGGYGKAPGVVNEQLRRQAIGSEEVIDVRPADLLKPEMAKLRADIGALARCEEDVLTFAMFPDIGRKFLEEREAGTLTPEALLPIPEAGKVAAHGGEGVPTEFVIDVHGETYRVDITGVGVKAEGKRHFYLSIDACRKKWCSSRSTSSSAVAAASASRPARRVTSAPPCRATSSMCWSRKAMWSRPARPC